VQPAPSMPAPEPSMPPAPEPSVLPASSAGRCQMPNTFGPAAVPRAPGRVLGPGYLPMPLAPGLVTAPRAHGPSHESLQVPRAPGRVPDMGADSSVPAHPEPARQMMPSAKWVRPPLQPRPPMCPPPVFSASQRDAWDQTVQHVLDRGRQLLEQTTRLCGLP
jgi:hypothetical protein